jgi:ABC-type multidrug transport system fused ATPase/permease subunit
MWWHDDFSDDEQQGSLPTFKMLKSIHPYVRKHIFVFSLAFILALIGVGMILMQPIIFKRIVDIDFPSGNVSSLMRSAFYYLLLLIGGGLTTGLATVLLGRAGVDVVNHIKRDLFSRVLGLGLPWIEKHQVGTLVSRVESDSQRLVSLTSTMAMRILSAMAMLFGAIIVIARVDLRLFAIASLFLPLMIVGTLILFSKMRPLFREERRLYSKITGHVAELVPATRLLQALGRRDWVEARVATANRIYKKFTVRLMFLEYGFWNGMGLFEIIMTVVALWMGSIWVADGSMTAGTLVMFAQYAAMIYWPVIELSEQLAEIQRAGGAADRIFGLLQTEDTVPVPENPVKTPECPKEIEFSSVWFEYEKGNPVIKDFDLKIKTGETIALVGPTGGGKSTIINLVTRLRDVSEGFIKLNGINVKDLDPREYRKLFGLVLQDLYLFPASIYENLSAFREDVSEDQVREAARIAGIEQEILSREGGFSGVLSERGADLSYGQRQLLALARALAVNPQILILDEATSSVDPRTEKSIQRTLELLSRDRTTLIVAHRLSTVRFADRILVIKDGRIAEQGVHDELYAQGGIYTELVDSQLGINDSTSDKEDEIESVARDTQLEE